MTDDDNPWRQTVEPTITRDGASHRENATCETHPAYAVIQANRVSGSTNLFQSDFNHTAYISIRIATAEVVRDLSNDWVHSGKRGEYIEVNLSEAQWASFVSAMNCGVGTPCTVRHLNREPVPGIAKPKDRREQFERESSTAVKRAMERMSALAETIKGLGLSKTKEKALLTEVELAARGIDSTQDFIATQFAEHMESTVEHAKAEVHGYVNGAVRHLGLQALAAKQAGVEPLQLTFPGDSNVAT